MDDWITPGDFGRSFVAGIRFVLDHGTRVHLFTGVLPGMKFIMGLRQFREIARCDQRA